MKNLPVPTGPRAPVTPAWLVKVAPFALVIAAYRFIRPERRAEWNNGVSTSHEAMAAVLAPGGGWKAFRHYTTPRFSRRRQPRSYPLAWALFLFLAVKAPGHDHGVSWAN